MDDKAAVTAQSLLFGPRRSGQTLSPAVRKAKKNEMTKMGKKRAKLSAKDQYITSWNTAASDFAAGNSTSLEKLLSAPAPHGLKGAEKQSLANVHGLIQSSVHSFRSPSSSAQLDNQSGQLEVIIELRDRLKEKKFSENVQSWVGNTFVEAAVFVANQEIKDDLISIKDKVGSLPQVFTGSDWEDHFVKNGESACPARVDPYQSPSGSSFSAIESVASKEVSCEECLRVYKNDKASVDWHSPAQWASLLETSTRDIWDDDRAGLGFHGYGVESYNVQQSYKKLLTKVRLRANEMIDRHGQALIKAKKSP